MVKRYCKGCVCCQEGKIDQQALHAPLNPHSVPDHPWQVVTTDMIRPLPESNGFNVILVFMDKFGKGIKVEPTNTTLTSEGFANIMRDRVIRDEGLPEMLIAD